MKKIFTANFIKILAVVVVIIDHIGLYMYNEMSGDVYFVLRTIGRIAVPLFTYFLVQGYFYTKDLKKYIMRVFILAVITQFILFVLGYINQEYYPKYSVGVNNYLGILFSYFLSLTLIAVFDKKIWLENFSENQNWIFRITSFALISLAYMKLNIEFDMRIPFIVLGIFAIEKFFMRDDVLLKKQKNVSCLKHIMYTLMILLTFAISLIFVTYTPGNKYAMLLAIILIALYNGDRGSGSKMMKYLFYVAFPVQHFVLYMLAMI